MFIRKRISPSPRHTASYQVIETYREDGKVKQRVLLNLGRFPTPHAAVDYHLQLKERGCHDYEFDRHFHLPTLEAFAALFDPTADPSVVSRAKEYVDTTKPHSPQRWPGGA